MALNTVEKIDGPVKIQHVLASVSDKTGLDVLIPALVEVNPDVTIYSTGGTYAAIEKLLGDKAAKNLVPVSEYTGQPEMQGGLVKTLDFKIYMGLLSETYNEAHKADLERTQGVMLDMVIVNLYPFKAVTADPNVPFEKARGNIDIGGPCMVRASAKNFHRVASVTDPASYADIVDELESNNGALSLECRFALAKKAFAHTGEYDTAIAAYFADKTFEDMAGEYTVVR